MIQTIKDGSGRGYEAAINKFGQISTDGNGLLRDSLNIGGSFVFIVDDANVDAGDTLLLVRNDIDRPFAVDRIDIESGDVGGEYWIHVVTANFTAAGTAVTPFNVNTYSGKPLGSGLTAMGDETGNTQGTVIHRELLAATTMMEWEPYGLILGKGVAIGVDQIAEEAAGKVSIWGHYME